MQENLKVLRQRVLKYAPSVELRKLFNPEISLVEVMVCGSARLVSITGEVR
jgi:hypothetical protein